MKSLRFRLGRWALAVPVMILAGCATLNESECRSADWRTIGFEDGSRGYTAERIAQHRKACARYGIPPDLSAYQRGRDTGLRDYCRPGSGFRVGASGSQYAGVCPADLEDDFLDAYETGRHLYGLRAEVDRLESEIAAKRGTLSSVESELAGVSALIAGDTTPQQRAGALDEATRLAEEIGRLKTEIDFLEIERANRESDVAAYRTTLRYPE